MAKGIMRRFKLDEISAVDRPAQKGAKAVIMKRDGSGDGDGGLYLAKRDDVTLPDGADVYLKRALAGDDLAKAVAAGECMADGAFQIANRDDLGNAIRVIGLAKDAAAAKSHIIARARSLDATSLLPNDWKVGKSIGGDLVIEIARVAPRELPAMLDDVVKVEEIEAQVAKFDDEKVRADVQRELGVAKSALIASCWSALDTTSPEDVPSVLRKNFDEYKNHVQGLVPGGADLTKRDTKSGDDSMALKDIAKGLGLKEDATEEAILKAIEKANADAKLNDVLAKMSGKHKAFMENDKAKMPSGGKEAFSAMTPDARDAHMSANPCPADVDKADKEDELLKSADGKTTIRKSVVGADTFAFMKAQQDAIEKAADKDATNDIAKRIAPLKYVIGKAEDTAALLRRLEKNDPKDAAAVEGLLKAANEVMAKSEQITKEFGKTGGDGGAFAKAFDEITAKAEVLRKADPKLSVSKSMVMARDQNPDLAKREQDEAREARKAA